MGAAGHHEPGVSGSLLRGRDREVASVRDLLADPAVRVVTITGRGGVGKTALAAAVVGENGDRPVVVVRLDGVVSHELVLGTILSATGAVAGGDPVVAAADALGDRSPLLVLDNFEHVLDAAPLLPELLARTPSLQLLVTSQAPLRLSAERVVSLRALPVPAADLGTLDALAAVPSVQLYCDRAAAVDRAFVLDETNADVVAELCRRLDGLPLAIELAAARAAVLPAAELVRRLDTAPLDVLHRASVDAPDRHHSVRDALDWTTQLLDDEPRRLLRRLSVVHGAFDLDVVEALGGDTAVDDLAALVDFHLVEPRPGPPGRATFGLPAAIRAHAGELLEATEERTAVLGGHRAATAAWARAAARGAETADEPAWLDQIASRYDDLVACLLDSIHAGEAGTALDIVGALAPWWAATGYRTGHDALLRAALDLAHDRQLASGAHAVALASWAFLAVQQQLVDDQHTGVRFAALAAAEALALGHEDVEVRLHVLSARVLAAPLDPDPDAAGAAAEAGLALANAAGMKRWEAAFQAWRGMALHRAGDEEAGVRQLLRSLATAREIGDDRTVVVATLGLRPLERRFPEISDVLLPARELLEIARRSRHTMLADVSVPHAVAEALAAGDVDGAGELVLDGLAVARTAPRALAGFLLLAAAQWFAAAGDDENAAWLHAVIEPSLPLLDASTAAEHVDWRRRQFAAVQQSLPDGGRSARLRAEGLSWSAAAGQALDVVRRHQAQRLAAPKAPRPTTFGGRHLTPRQTDVLRLAAAGLSNGEIAVELGLTTKTVMHHLHAVYLALGVRGRTEAAAWAFRNGIAS